MTDRELFHHAHEKTLKAINGYRQGENNRSAITVAATLEQILLLRDISNTLRIICSNFHCWPVTTKEDQPLFFPQAEPEQQPHIFPEHTTHNYS